MKAIINNNIYSGLSYLDPNVELTEDASQELYTMVYNLGTAICPPNIFHQLGETNSFTIYFEDNQGTTQMVVESIPEVTKITRYRKIIKDNRVLVKPMIPDRYFIDSVQLNNYLASLFSAIIED